MAMEPPFEKTYNSLFNNSSLESNDPNRVLAIDDECMLLPVIDLSRLNSGELEQERCIIREMAQAASQWGFFQIVNHGIPREVLEKMYHEEKQLFHLPFSQKMQENFLNLSTNSYRWGNLKASCPDKFSWSEAFHLSHTDISNITGRSSLRSTMEVYAQEVFKLAQRLCDLLGKNSNVEPNYFQENCQPGSCYLRMNKYYPCRFSSDVFGLVPHTDSDFLTVLYQDRIGGLQVKKDGRWIGVKPCPDALIINVGDLFQALSNGLYKSIEHRVVPPRDDERLSIAFFFCPSYDKDIQSFVKPEIYRKFSFREYKEQVQRDIEATGDKVGLSRFLLKTNIL